MFVLVVFDARSFTVGILAILTRWMLFLYQQERRGGAAEKGIDIQLEPSLGYLTNTCDATSILFVIGVCLFCFL